MEWIRNNPKAAALLGVVSVAVLATFVALGLSGGKPPAPPSSLGSPFPTTVTPPVTLPTPSPSSVASALAGFASAGMGGMPPGLGGTGQSFGLTPHTVVISAGSDGPLLGVGWRIPTASGPRAGKDLSYRKSFSHTARVFGKPDYAQLYTYVGPNSTRVWCTVTVDGRVTDHRVAQGPWGQVYCQG